MTSKEVFDERERIKIVYNKLESDLIERRQKMKRKKSRHTASISQIKSLRERFFWYIDNPNYVRTEKNQEL